MTITYSKDEILNTCKWIKISKLEDDAKLPDADRLVRLESHHIAETEFLISFIRDIALGKILIVE